MAAGNALSLVARVLIEAGADVNARDNDGVTVLMIAIESKAWNVVALLEAAGAR